MTSDNLFPATLYGSNISYFSGKMENYFRLKGLDYTLLGMQFPQDEKRVIENTGVMQIPALELADGRWMTDSTKMIQWFEEAFPDQPVVPVDPLQRFVSLLLEDYADEWLWRPAMHYRWYYPEGAYLQSRHLADELMGSLSLPGMVKRWNMRKRQRDGYTTGDGITQECVPGVEAIFLRTLEQLQAIFEVRPFLFGDRPSLADVGFSGPFFRHFALDPVPLEIVRQRAPAVLEWVARLWNTRLSDCDGTLVSGIPEDIGPILDEIGKAYLPYLCANVTAVSAGEKRFDADIDGVPYRGARYSRYRVWCLQELRSHFQSLGVDEQSAAKDLLQRHHCWEPLWRDDTLPLAPDQESGLPFRGNTKMVGANE
ncbi:MAG: glutathione S-transferase family protein [Halioglobus sp.]